MNYQEFIDYIYKRHSGNVKLGLERMEGILSEMGNPNLKLKGIHVGGTNGKGSTAALCEALALAHGLQTGLNTSPHLIDYRERFRLNGENIQSDDLINTYKFWQKIFEKYEASFFEITTSLAFQIFFQKQVDISIFEVGLGGRLDGTRPFSSTVTVITSISYDHTKSLGKTIRQIATEKAGIIKPNVPLIIGKMSPPAAAIIRSTADNLAARTYQFGKDFQIDNITIDQQGTSFDYTFEDWKFYQLKTSLIGQHQAHNAALALTSFLIYSRITGIEPCKDRIRQGLQKAVWTGRFQYLSHKPEIIIDGAHNVQGIQTLITNLDILYPKQKLVFIIAILRDKNLRGVIDLICTKASFIYISRNSSTRAAEHEEQAKYVKANQIEYDIADTVINAYKQAVEKLSTKDVLVITGSLYTISEIIAQNKSCS